MKYFFTLFSILILSTKFILAQHIACGYFHNLVMCQDSTLQAWGLGLHGQLGNGSSNDEPTPVNVLNLNNIIAIGAGYMQSLAVRNDGTVWIWGTNFQVELGTGMSTGFFNPIPAQVLFLNNVIKVAGSSTFSFALKNDGTVWAWGDNNLGQLGDGTGVSSDFPVLVSNLSNITSICGRSLAHGIALKADSTVWSWGNNYEGQLGNGTTNSSLFPVQVPNINTVIAISSGWSHNIVLRNDGTVWGWGLNDFGQLGIGNVSNSLIPVQVSGLTDIIAVACGDFFSVAVKNDGTVWAWGDNSAEQLGNGSFANALFPVQVNNIASVVEVSAGTDYVVAIKNDGTAWNWGTNGSGIPSLGPTQIPNFCNTTSLVHEILESNLFKIFPNPNYGRFQVELPSKTELKIYNSFGEMKYSMISDGLNNDINLSSLETGIYFMTIFCEDINYKRKLIIMN